jgi:hypothetical protein
VVAHTSNHSYQRGGDWEDLRSRPAWGKKVIESLISTNKLNMVMSFCNPSYAEVSPWQKCETLSRKICRKGWRCGLSGKVLAYQVRGPEFKFEYHRRKTKEQKNCKLSKSMICMHCPL